MPKRKAFTLIEVMVAVMIVSVVIAALLQMQGNTTTKLFGIKEMMQTNQYNSFLLSLDDKYGFETSHIDMSRLVDDFDLESDLRRRLKAMKVELDYQEIKRIDTSEFEASSDDATDDAEQENSGSGIVFEIGKSILKTDDFTSQLMRVRLQ